MRKFILIFIMFMLLLSNSVFATVQTLIADFQVNDNTENAEQSYSVMVIDDNTGNFIISWADRRNGNYDVYAQRFDNNANPLGDNFKVNETINNANDYFASIAIDNNGNFIICWQDDRNGNTDIYAQCYDNQGIMIGTNFKVSDDTGSDRQEAPEIAFDNNGNFVICWNDYRTGNVDIRARYYDTNVISQGSSFIVNDDTENGDQYMPQIAFDDENNFIIAWGDYRNSTNYADTYAQLYNNEVIPIGDNFKVNDLDEISWQSYPKVTYDNNGHFIIAWAKKQQRSDDIHNAYVRYYNTDGTPLSSSIRVDNTVEPTGRGLDIAADNNGNCIISWGDTRNDISDIYAQLYDNTGVALGSNFLMTNITNDSQIHTGVAFWNGCIYNTWKTNHKDGITYDIWANVLTLNYFRITSIEDIPNDQGKQVRITWNKHNSDVPDSSNPITHYSIWRNSEANSDKSWDFISNITAHQFDEYSYVAPTLWDSTMQNTDYYTEFFISAHTTNPSIFYDTETAIGYSIDNLVPNTPQNLQLASNGNIITLLWDANQEEDFQYYAIYRSEISNFTPKDNHIVTITSDTICQNIIDIDKNYYYVIAAYDFNGGRSEFSEEIAYNPTYIRENEKPAIPTEYYLYPNYPNPFNPETTIKYQLPETTLIKLNIYNSAGQLVKTLVNEIQNAGTYNINWNGYDNNDREIASGLYIYHLICEDYTQTRRMMLLK